jgi:hypothetical protein
MKLGHLATPVLGLNRFLILSSCAFAFAFFGGGTTF